MAHKLQPKQVGVGLSPSPEQCDAEVERICNGAAFRRAPVMRRLLKFLATETLAGRGVDLKAYGVAVDGLGKGQDFDAQADSYPRVQVGRLRRMIETFYAEEGGSESAVRVSIPNGSYRVHWTSGPQADAITTPQPESRNVPAAAPRFPIRQWLVLLVGIAAVAGIVVYIQLLAPSLAPALNIPVDPSRSQALVPPPVMEVEPVSVVEGADRALAQRVDRILGDALHRTWVFDVRAIGESGAAAPAPAGAYRLTGTLVGAERKLLYLTIWDRRHTTQIWSRRLELAGATSFADALGPSINAIMSPFGVIGSRERRALAGKSLPGYPCMIRYSQYYMSNAAALAEPVRTCLDLTLKQDPGDVPALMAKMVTRIRDAVTHPEKAAEVRRESLVLARRAMDADPYSADASMAMALAAYLNNMCDLGNASATEALERNPYDGYAQARAGLYMFQCGDAGYEATLRRAWALDNTLPAITAMPIVIGMSERGEGKAALRFALRIPVTEGFRKASYELTMAAAYAGANDVKAARGHWAQAVRAAPVPANAQPAAALKRILMSPRLAGRTELYLRKRGVFG